MRWFVFICLLVIIAAGACLLAIDYETTEEAVQGLAGAFTCFGSAWLLTRYCTKHNLLPKDD